MNRPAKVVWLKAAATAASLLIMPCLASAQGGQAANPWAVSPGPSAGNDHQSAFTQGYLRGFEQGYRRGAEQRPNGNPEVAHTGPGAAGGQTRSDWNLSPGSTGSSRMVTGAAPASPPTYVPPPAEIAPAGIPGLPDSATRTPAHRWGEYPPMPGQASQPQPQLSPSPADRHYPYARSIYPYGGQTPPAFPGFPQVHAPPAYPYGGVPSTFTNPYAGLTAPWGIGASPYGVPGVPPW